MSIFEQIALAMIAVVVILGLRLAWACLFGGIKNDLEWWRQ